MAERLSDHDLTELENLLVQSEHLGLVLDDMRIEYGADNAATLHALWDALKHRNVLISAAVRALPSLLAEARAYRTSQDQYRAAADNS